jgi:hypothetical protein
MKKEEEKSFAAIPEILAKAFINDVRKTRQHNIKNAPDGRYRRIPGTDVEPHTFYRFWSKRCDYRAYQADLDMMKKRHSFSNETKKEIADKKKFYAAQILDNMENMRQTFTDWLIGSVMDEIDCILTEDGE